jgi:nucleoid-associated protein YgaU
MAGALPVGWVRLSSKDPPLTITARLSDEQTKVEAGYGGWEEVARPRRPPITTFKSLPGLRMTLSILLDGWANDTSVERQISQLQLLGRAVASTGEPPQVRVTATGSAIPYQGRTWVVSDLVFGDALMNDAGDRVRQKMTISLLEYVEDAYLIEQSKANQQRAKAEQTATRRASAGGGSATGSSTSVGLRDVRSGVTYARATAFGGETLVRIAARQYGNCERWIDIATLNGLRDPRAIAKGQVIRLP